MRMLRETLANLGELLVSGTPLLACPVQEVAVERR